MKKQISLFSVTLVFLVTLSGCSWFKKCTHCCHHKKHQASQKVQEKEQAAKEV